MRSFFARPSSTAAFLVDRQRYHCPALPREQQHQQRNNNNNAHFCSTLTTKALWTCSNKTKSEPSLLPPPLPLYNRRRDTTPISDYKRKETPLFHHSSPRSSSVRSLLDSSKEKYPNTLTLSLMTQAKAKGSLLRVAAYF